MNVSLMKLRSLMVSAAIVLGLVCSAQTGLAAGSWQAGFGKVVITPEGPMWLSGYAGRTKPAEGKVHDLHARAIAIRDGAGKTVVMISTDLIGVPAAMARFVSEAIERKHGIARADVMFTCSHTHCGPVLDDALTSIYFLSPAEAAKVPQYSQQLKEKLIDVIGKALSDLQPARLATSIGRAEFAVPRRPPIGLGPYDHEVPVLRVLTADGQKLRGVVFGYACHNTTLGFDRYCGDYAGFAALDLEERHPGATALFHSGCGGDQNPLPRKKLELAIKYGRMLSVAVDQVLAGEMRPVTGKLRTDFRRIDLELASVPNKEELEQWLKGSDPYKKAMATKLLPVLAEKGELPKTYPYPIQVWMLGDEVTWIALGGETVVEYSLRLKRALGFGRTWVTGYSNDVMAYIPSERVLAEGGYEGETSMQYYQLPSKWKSGLEARIVETAQEMAARLAADAKQARPGG